MIGFKEICCRLSFCSLEYAIVEIAVSENSTAAGKKDSWWICYREWNIRDSLLSVRMGWFKLLYGR